jgi:hypothetical protein
MIFKYYHKTLLLKRKAGKNDLAQAWQFRSTKRKEPENGEA